MTYDKSKVEEMFTGTSINPYPHQTDFITTVKFLIRTKGSFSMDEVHSLLVEMGRPETSKYNSLATVLVNCNLVKKMSTGIENRFYPTTLMCLLIGEGNLGGLRYPNS